MKRIEITRGVVLGPDRIGIPGEVHEVDDRVARILIHHKQARVAPEPAKVTEAPRPQVVEKGKKGSE